MGPDASVRKCGVKYMGPDALVRKFEHKLCPNYAAIDIPLPLPLFTIVAKQQPSSPAARQPGSPATQRRGSSAARQPSNPAARQLGS